MFRLHLTCYSRTITVSSKSVCNSLSFLILSFEIYGLFSSEMKYFVLVAVTAIVVKTCAARQCQVKFVMIGNHSACLGPSPLMEPGTDAISREERAEIVSLHNTLRAKVRPPAANMQRVVWDDEIAVVAQGWASNCVYEHEPNGHRQIPGRFALGQNLAIMYKDWYTTINEWFAEHKDFTLGKGSMFPGNTGRPVGHYVQMVYATAARIGCGQAACGRGVGKFYVCNYAFGVTNPTHPYEEANKMCEACPNNCDQDLCDCGGRVCENGGILDPNTCRCNCTDPTFMEPQNCKLNCSAAEGKWYCTDAYYKREWCLTTANLQYQCPVFCQLCPWAGMNFKEPTEQPKVSTTATTERETTPTLTSPLSSSQTTVEPVITTTPLQATTATPDSITSQLLSTTPSPEFTSPVNPPTTLVPSTTPTQERTTIVISTLHPTEPTTEISVPPSTQTSTTKHPITTRKSTQPITQTSTKDLTTTDTSDTTTTQFPSTSSAKDSTTTQFSSTSQPSTSSEPSRSTIEGWWLPTVVFPTTVGVVSAGIMVTASEWAYLVLLLVGCLLIEP